MPIHIFIPVIMLLILVAANVWLLRTKSDDFAIIDSCLGSQGLNRLASRRRMLRSSDRPAGDHRLLATSFAPSRWSRVFIVEAADNAGHAKTIHIAIDPSYKASPIILSTR